MTRLLILTLMGSVLITAQIKPKVECIGGDDVPQLKQRIESSLVTVLLEINRIQKGNGSLTALKEFFTPEAFETLQRYVITNGAYTARKEYHPHIIGRQNGDFYDIRSITLKVRLGETEASDNQNIIFTFDKNGLITSVRSMLPNYDYQSVITGALSAKDSVIRGIILDFMERFRMAYNTKDTAFLEKVYSDEALIFVGTVLEEKKGSDDMLKKSYLSGTKIKLIQQSKREYIDGLKSRAFKLNSYINVVFKEFKILEHEKIPFLYGVSCWQEWRSSHYSDQGYLFLMIDFRNQKEPIIHVRAWQPGAFVEDSSFVNLYDFDIVSY